MAANPHMPRRGRGHRKLEGGESSQAAQSQVVVSTLEHVHETRDNGYDPIEQHYIAGLEDPYFQPPEV